MHAHIVLEHENVTASRYFAADRFPKFNSCHL